MWWVFPDHITYKFKDIAKPKEILVLSFVSYCFCNLLTAPIFGTKITNSDGFSTKVALWIIGRMRTPVREAFSYGIRHGIRHIHCDSMKYDLMLRWITMNMPYPVPYPIWKCLPYGSTHPPSYEKFSRKNENDQLQTHFAWSHKVYRPKKHHKANFKKV